MCSLRYGRNVPQTPQKRNSTLFREPCIEHEKPYKCEDRNQDTFHAHYSSTVYLPRSLRNGILIPSMSKQPVSKRGLAYMGGFFMVGLIVTVGAVLIGRADKGQIDVSATIANSNAERVASGVEGDSPVQPIPEVFANTRNGGLVPQSGDVTPPPETESTPVETGTTTDDMATSTDGTGDSASGSGDTTLDEASSPDNGTE